MLETILSEAATKGCTLKLVLLKGRQKKQNKSAKFQKNL